MQIPHGDVRFWQFKWNIPLENICSIAKINFIYISYLWKKILLSRVATCHSQFKDVTSDDDTPFFYFRLFVSFLFSVFCFWLFWEFFMWRSIVQIPNSSLLYWKHVYPYMFVMGRLKSNWFSKQILRSF